MVKRDTLVRYLDEYLRIGEVKDVSWNGLQFEGTDSVRKVAFAVDAGIETFEKAAALGAQMVIVHHGHFWGPNNPSLVGWNKARIDVLYRHNLSLYASHLPLDRHPVVGNNAQLLKLLGARITEPFGNYHGTMIGFAGTFARPRSLTAIEKTLTTKLNADCIVLPFGRKQIRTMGVVSGGGSQGEFQEAIQKGLDLYLTGDSTEIYHVARDAGINVIFAGHHATETVGVRALMDTVGRKLKVGTTFIDIRTGL